jgi:hypothetical protein
VEHFGPSHQKDKSGLKADTKPAKIQEIEGQVIENDLPYIFDLYLDNSNALLA